MNLSAASALELSARLIACSIALGALEGFWLWSRGHFHPDGIWSWRIIGESFRPRWAGLASPLMSHRGVLGILTLRLVCASLVVVLPYPHPLFGLSLAVLVILHLLMMLRLPWGGEGSDQMTLIVLVPALLATMFSHDVVAVTGAALFVAANITASYVTSGLAKARSAQWRTGGALTKIMNHHTYGHWQFSRLLRSYPAVGTALTFLVMAFQISFFLFYFIPMPYALIYVAGGLMFHAGIAYFMRLNQFFIVFVGTYPCLIFAHEFVRQSILG